MSRVAKTVPASEVEAGCRVLVDGGMVTEDFWAEVDSIHRTEKTVILYFPPGSRPSSWAVDPDRQIEIRA